MSADAASRGGLVVYKWLHYSSARPVEVARVRCESRLVSRGLDGDAGRQR